MKTILIDVDDVMCPNHFLPVLNSYLGKNYTENDIDDVKFEKVFFPDEKERNKFYDYYLSVDSYQGLTFYKDAKRVIKKFCKKHRVLILTSACHYERTLEMGRQYTDKWNFLLKELPFFPPENILYSSQKDVFKADLLIDDRVENLTGDYKFKLLYTCFHNKNISDKELKEKGIVRVNNWKEIEKFVDGI